MTNGKTETDTTHFQLQTFGENTFSQTGEDGIIDKIFQMLPTKEEKWCVEIGAWDGIHFSNTRNLILNKGWSSVLIEGDKNRHASLQKTYTNNPKVTSVHAMVSFEGENTLDEILAKTRIPKDFDLLSVDVDGNDYHIWNSISTYKPHVVVIEFNPSIPDDIIFIQEKDMKISQGSSLRALTELGKRKGYELIAATRLNGFFVREEFFSVFGLKDNQIHSLFDGKKYQTRVFQLYDGTLVIDGCDRLLWHDIPLRHAIQPLPKFLRIFPYSSHHWFRYLIFRIFRRIVKFVSRFDSPGKKD